MVRQWLTSRTAQPASPSAAQRDDIWLRVTAMIQGQITRFINTETDKTVLVMPLLSVQIAIRLHLRF